METTKKTKKPLKAQSLLKSGNLSKESKIANLKLILKKDSYKPLLPTKVNINDFSEKDLPKIQDLDIKIVIPKNILSCKESLNKYLEIIKNKNIKMDYKLFKYCIENKINIKKFKFRYNINNYIDYINETNSLECLDNCGDESFTNIFRTTRNLDFSIFYFKCVINNIKNKNLLNFNIIYSYMARWPYYLSKKDLINLLNFNSKKIDNYIKNYKYKLWLSVKGSLKDLEEHKNKSSYFNAILKNPNCSEELKDHIQSIIAIKDILK